MGSETPNLRGIGEAHSAGAEFIFAQLAGRRIEGDVDKALDEFTDLRRVTTPTEQTGTAPPISPLPLSGAPLSAPSAASDPLGSIVRGHLDRAATAGVATAPASEPIEVSSEQLSAAQQSVAAHAEVREENIEAAASAVQLAEDATAAAAEVQQVQKEFAELFDGDAKKIAEAPREPAPAGEPLPENSNIDLEEAALSQAEFDALLNKTETPAEAAPPDESTESAIKSAEGVLEEELMQLMAEGPPAKAEAPKPPAATALQPAPVAETPAPQVESPKAEIPPAAALENIPAPVVAPTAEATAAPASASEPAPVAAAPTAAAPASMPTAPAGMSAPPVVVIEAPEESHEEEVASKRGGLAKDIFVMIGQLIDMPFRAISVSDKNIIGLAAFLLLLGGVTLWVIATFFFQPHYDKPAGHGEVHMSVPSNSHKKLVAPENSHAPKEASHAPATTSPTTGASSAAVEKSHEPAAGTHAPAAAEHSAPAGHSAH